MKLLQSHYTLSGQRKKHRQQQARSQGSPFLIGFRNLVWVAFLVIAVTCFVRRISYHLGNKHEDFVYYNFTKRGVLPHKILYNSKLETQQQEGVVLSRPHPPRILRYNSDNNEASQLTNTSHLDYQQNSIKRNYSKVIVKVGGVPPKRKRLVLDKPCIPMDEWQSARFQSCNNVHEMNMGRIQFINCGGSRCAFKFFDVDGTPQVLKTQFFDTVDAKDLEYARKDALAMERLTKSPYVANIFGSCGMTQTLEYSAYGNLFDWMKLTRAKQRSIPSPVERLKFGIQISTAVADVHSLNEADGMVSMTHNDICCHQFIHIDGIFKLGDFHLSTFHKKHQKTGETCTTYNFPMNSALKKVRAPEEMYERAKASREKIDVYLTGNMLYYILTNRWMFEGISTEEAMQKLTSGERSDFGFEVTDPADVAMVKAVNWTWNQEQENRPKAREVSTFLKNALREIEGNEEDYVVRVSIPPLPEDYDFSDVQFYENLGMDLDGNIL